MVTAWDRKPDETEKEWRKRRQRMMAAIQISKQKKERNMAKGKGRIHDSHPSNIAYIDRAGNGRWYAPCISCNKKVSSTRSTGINRLMDIWVKRGWKHLGDRKWQCEECQHAKKNGNGQEIDMEKVERLQEEHAETTANARKAKLEAIEFLQDAFDGETGIFKEGYSDQIISETVGLSHQVIITIREEYFGELKAKSELDILRDELAAFAAEMNEKVKLFTNRIEKIEGETK